MDLFVNVVNKDKFRYTNKIWNDLKINSRWSIGGVSHLITSKHFKSKEEWKEFYFKSGEERLEKLNRLTDKDKNILQNYKKYTYSSIDKDLVNLNFNYGRTEEELKDKALYMYNYIVNKGNPLNITLPECVYIVKFRTIAETWNGIIQRELNTIKELQKTFPDLDFIKTSGKIDYEYEVDCEVYMGDKLITGIQIKPQSYKVGITPEIIQTKVINESKNNKYLNDFGVQVLYVYSKTNGEIINKDVIESISCRKGIFLPA